jgi:uronate dehydrogenase
MGETKRILITGAAGKVGSVLVRGLGDRYILRGLDRQAMPELDDVVVADLRDMGALTEAVRGMDAVIHLAGAPNAAALWEDVLESNIAGMYNVLEAAHQAGVKRVAYASRAGLLAPYPEDVRRTVDLPVRPESYYSVSKAFAENLGYMYAARFGMEVVCVRIGNLKTDRPEPSHPHHLGHTDCVTVFEQAVTWPDVDFEIVFGVSGSSVPLYDLEHGRKAIGYYPKQGFPETGQGESVTTRDG